MRQPIVYLVATGMVLSFLLAACAPSPPTPTPQPVETSTGISEPVSQAVSAKEGAAISPLEYGFSIVIPAEALTQDTEVSIGRVNDPASMGSSRAVAPVYELDLGEAELGKPIEVSIELPAGSAGEIAEAQVMIWTGSEWDYLDTVVREGWSTTTVSSVSLFSVGYRAYVLLERNDGTVEYGRLEVERLDDDTEVVVLYNGRGELVSESIARAYRGGLLYHMGELWIFPVLANLITEEPIGLSTFLEGLDSSLACGAQAEYDVRAQQSADLTLFPPGGWTSSCSAENGYGGTETTLGLRYQQGRLPYGAGTGRGPWLFVQVTEAENLVGDYVCLILYGSSAPILAAKMDVRDMVPGREFRLTLPLIDSQIPVANPHLVALTVGQPNIPWWQFWEDSDRRLLCAYGEEATSGEWRAANYYVDSVSGSDSNPGTSEDEPWRTLTPVHGRDFVPGDVVLLKRGSSWTGGLVIDDSGVEGNPITFTTYGTGDKPIFRSPGGWQVVTISADWVVLEGLLVEEAEEAGVSISNGSNNNIVRDIEATDVGIGIAIHGQYNLITRNYVHDLHMVHNTPDGDDDYGAVGIWFFNSNNEASYNRMVNCIAPSYDYGFDGGVFEFYGVADNNYFHHNWGTESNYAFEVSGGSAKDNVVAYNVFVNNGGGVGVFHIHQGGYGSDVENFRFENNVVVETLSRDDYVFWFSDTPSAGTLIVRNNIFRIDGKRFVFKSSSFTHDHNLYHLMSASTAMSHQDSFIPGEGELFADPLFVDAAGGDFHLQVGSPAIDAGVDLGYSLDYDGRPVPIGTAPDIGAHEYGG